MQISANTSQGVQALQFVWEEGFCMPRGLCKEEYAVSQQSLVAQTGSSFYNGRLIRVCKISTKKFNLMKIQN